MKIISTGVGVMSLAAAAYLAQAAQAEWAVTDIYWSEPEISAGVLSSRHLDTSYSYNTSRELLTRCITTISSKYFEEVTDAENSTISTYCRNFAQGLVEKNARHAEAHLLLALLGEDMRDPDAVRSNLSASQVLAPRDRFNVEWRLILAHRASQWSGEALDGYDCRGDLQLLGEHLPANQTLAYLRDNNAPLLEKCSA